MQEAFSNSNKIEFYTDAAKYWEKIPPTLDGMLGGFGFISQTDIGGSNVFLKSLFKVRNSTCFSTIIIFFFIKVKNCKLELIRTTIS